MTNASLNLIQSRDSANYLNNMEVFTTLHTLMPWEAFTYVTEKEVLLEIFM
jgi:hypothetical protein